jgi:hypothetical protein
LELFATTSRERLLSNNRDLDAHGRDKECLTETSRPGFIATMRHDLPQSTHRVEEKDTLRDILFLGLKAGHLRPKNRVFNGRYYALMGAQTQMFSATRARKHTFEVPEVLSVGKYLKGDSML